MNIPSFGPLSLRVEIERWPLQNPFRITGYSFTTSDVVTVSLGSQGRTGCGEACGVYYRGDDVTRMAEQIESLRSSIEAGVDRASLQRLMPASGARNAVDCALWDLEAKLTQRYAWQLAGLAQPRPLETVFTIGVDEPARMADIARAYTRASAIKLKLTGDALDGDRVRAVRAARGDVWLGVDANQGFTRSFLERLMPVFVDAQVELIEQPFAVGQEAQLDGFEAPIPIAADESLQGLADLPGLVGRFNVVNIKLDKCGGLTEGLALAREASRLGFDVMVGNMVGTSLSAAPAFLVGQLCKVVDLDGPAFLTADRVPAVHYEDGKISCPDELWGGVGATSVK